MRGDDQQTGYLFSYVSPEERVPADHPLRTVRRLTDTALQDLSPRFATMYSEIGRPSIPPEQLLRALLLQCLYSVRSERLLIEQLQYNLLFRWFVGLSLDAPVLNHSTFSKNRERLLANDTATGKTQVADSWSSLANLVTPRSPELQIIFIPSPPIPPRASSTHVPRSSAGTGWRFSGATNENLSPKRQIPIC